MMFLIGVMIGMIMALVGYAIGDMIKNYNK